MDIACTVKIVLTGNFSATLNLQWMYYRPKSKNDIKKTFENVASFPKT